MHQFNFIYSLKSSAKQQQQNTVKNNLFPFQLHKRSLRNNIKTNGHKNIKRAVLIDTFSLEVVFNIKHAFLLFFLNKNVVIKQHRLRTIVVPLQTVQENMAASFSCGGRLLVRQQNEHLLTSKTFYFIENVFS